MAILIPAYRKVTSKYVPAYDYLDEQEYMGFSVKAVFGRTKIHVDFSGDRHSETWVYLTPSREATRDEMVEMLFCFDRGCACEYDCCGCLHGGARNYELKQLGRRRWTVPLYYQPNY